MKKVLLYPNPGRDNDLRSTIEAAGIFNQAGIETCISDELPERVLLPDYLHVCPLQETLPTADMIICLGGDGTILHIARSAAIAQVPILGINFGKRGFMAELERNELNMLQKIIEGEYSLDTRMMLDVLVFQNGGLIFSSAALNDAVITKGLVSHLINISVKADNFIVSSFPSDGVVISTPTGSTAYSLSAGGPVVEPTAENILITPVCAHSLHARPYVLTSDHVIGMEFSGYPDKAAYLSVDGGQSLALEHDFCLTIKKSQMKTKLVRIKGRSFYDIINHKLITEKVY